MQTDLPNLSSFGQWTADDVFVIERDQIAAYARATNDTTPAHLDGNVAGPIFAVLPAWRTAHPLLLSTLSDELERRTLHGEQDIIFRRPLEAGMTLRTSAAIIGVRSSGAGTSLIACSMSLLPDGEPVLEQYTTLFVRGLAMSDRGDVAPPRLPAAPAGKDSPPESFADRIDADQTARYSAASGDTEPIHLDPEVAKSFGFPGVINHGNSTFAIAARRVLHVACNDDVSKLRRIGVRFSRPVFPGDEVTTKVWPASPGGRVVSWESSLSDGSLCLKNGFAEISAD